MKEMQTLIIDRYKHNASDFDNIRWAIKATSKDKTRVALTCLCFQNGHVIGCDAHRLHKAKLEDPIKEGVYSIIKNTKTQVILTETEHEFPDIERIIPNIETMEQVSITDPDNNMFVNDVIKTSHYFNISYLLDTEFTTADLYHNSENKYFPVFLDAGFRHAFLMPLES